LTATIASPGAASRRAGGRGGLTVLIFLPPALLLFTIFVAMPMG
jgi:hypothetical protein